MKSCVEAGWGEELISSWRLQRFPCSVAYVNWVMSTDNTKNKYFETIIRWFLVLAQKVSHYLYWQSHLVWPGQVSGFPAVLAWWLWLRAKCLLNAHKNCMQGYCVPLNLKAVSWILAHFLTSPICFVFDPNTYMLLYPLCHDNFGKHSGRPSLLCAFLSLWKSVVDLWGDGR